MTGKVNQRVPEAVNMICWQVIANDHAVSLAAQSGQLELNFGTPLIAHNLLQSIKLLTNCSNMFKLHCVRELEVDKEKCDYYTGNSFAYATALNPYLGYSTVSKLVTEAYKKGKSLKDLIIEKKILTKSELEKIIASATGSSEIDSNIIKNLGKK